MTMSELDDMLFGSLGDRQSLSPREVARACGVAVRTVYKWCEEERVVSTALGNGTLRIVRHSVVSFYHQGIEARKDKLAAPPPSHPPLQRGDEGGSSGQPPKKSNGKPAGKSGRGWVRRY